MLRNSYTTHEGADSERFSFTVSRGNPESCGVHVTGAREPQERVIVDVSVNIDEKDSCKSACQSALLNKR